MDVFIGGICGSKLISDQSDIHANANFRLVGSHAIYSFVFVNNNRKSKIRADLHGTIVACDKIVSCKSALTVMSNKGTNAYTIRNFRRVKKNAYTRIACVYFASALFAYLRAALYVLCLSPYKSEGSGTCTCSK